MLGGWVGGWAGGAAQSLPFSSLSMLIEVHNSAPPPVSPKPSLSTPPTPRSSTRLHGKLAHVPQQNRVPLSYRAPLFRAVDPMAVEEEDLGQVSRGSSSSSSDSDSEEEVEEEVAEVEGQAKGPVKLRVRWYHVLCSALLHLESAATLCVHPMHVCIPVHPLPCVCVRSLYLACVRILCTLRVCALCAPWSRPSPPCDTDTPCEGCTMPRELSLDPGNRRGGTECTDSCASSAFHSLLAITSRV
jgi:hypothetical protein